MPRMLAALEINIAVQRERERKLLPKLLTNHMLFSSYYHSLSGTLPPYSLRLRKIISATGCAHYLHL